jgi:hypothetical protein
MKHRAKCLVCGQVVTGEDNKHNFCLCKSLWIEGASNQEGRIGFYNADEVLMIDDEGKEIQLNVIDNKTKDLSIGEHFKSGKAEFMVSADENGNPEVVDLNKIAEHAEGRLKTRRKELVKELKHMIEEDERLPSQAKRQPINFYDLIRYMIIIEAVLKGE